MLEIVFLDERRVRSFEIKAGVGWQFCIFAHFFDDCGQEAYFKEGTFVVTNDLINFRALDDRNTIYEVKLSAVEAGKIRFEVPGRKPLFHCGPLKDFQKENRRIDMAAFLKNRNPSEKITICENVVEQVEEAPYTETLQMEIDRNRDILRFYLNVTCRSKCVESICRKETGSKIKTMTLDKEVTFDFCKEPFMEIMKKITGYCERKNENVSVICKDYSLPPLHCVDIPNTIIKTESFEIGFEFENVSMVYVAKNIMNSSCYTDTLGGEYNIGNIVQETLKKTKGHTTITDYGASNLWKEVLSEDDEYIFGCWFK